MRVGNAERDDDTHALGDAHEESVAAVVGLDDGVAALEALPAADAVLPADADLTGDADGEGV